MSRITTPRIQHNSRTQNEAEFEYPFAEIGSDWSGYGWGLSDELPGEQSLPAGTFPHNIREWIWASPGANDEKPWWLLGRLDNGTYFFYDAWCDYTGFDCQGSMNLYVSETLETLVMKAMTNAAYGEYIKDTVPVEADQ